jgi:hypothetical protein
MILSVITKIAAMAASTISPMVSDVITSSKLKALRRAA